VAAKGDSLDMVKSRPASLPRKSAVTAMPIQPFGT
jgi:hypothetical protein